MSRVRLIGSRSNPQWQELRRLAQQPSAYRQQRRVWLEGEHLCSEAARRGESIELSVIGESAWSDSPLRALAEAAPEVLVLPDALLGALSTMDSAPPLAMVLPWPGELAMDPGAPSVVLDRLQDAGNVGTIIRSAAAFGFVQVLALKGCAALWSPKVMRAGMGAHFALRLIESLETDDLAVLEVPLLATSSHADQGVDSTALPWPCAWALGHEGQGLSSEVTRRCTMALRIPQPGGLESLNVAAAASICLYESARQRTAPG